MFGELDGIAHKVDQHLAQSFGIARDQAGNVGADQRVKFQAGGTGSMDKHVGNRFEDLEEIEINRFQLQLAGFDFRKVQECR